MQLQKQISSDLSRRRLDPETPVDDKEVLEWITRQYSSSTMHDEGEHGSTESQSLGKRRASSKSSLSSWKEESRKHKNLLDKHNIAPPPGKDDVESPSPEGLSVLERAHAMRGRISMAETKKLSTKVAFQEKYVMKRSLEPNVLRILSKVDSWEEFDVFALHAATNGHPLSALVPYLFRMHHLTQLYKLQEATLLHFLLTIENGYRPNPYHNVIHAADVTQNVHFFLSRESQSQVVHAFDYGAAIIAAAVHDVAHPGTTNNYHIRTSSEHAVTYNDKSVLENMHVAQAFRLMQAPESNLLANLSEEERVRARTDIIEMVLSTDMTHNQSHIAELNTMVIEHKHSGVAWCAEKKADRLMCMKTAIHAADLGNPCKPTEVCVKWTGLVMEEFFKQGDKEKKQGLVPSMLCDRNSTPLEKSQLGFIDFVVKPLFGAYQKLSPELSVCLELLAENRTHWNNQLEEKKKAKSEDTVR
jgi:hypothetical protein